MRIYLPATSGTLRSLLERGSVGPAPLTAFAVTAGLREWYVDDDLEALEYAAMSDAARASLRLLDADDIAVRRRIVLAADVPGDHVVARDDLDRGVVRVRGTVPLSAVAAVHADDRAAQDTVALAARAVIAAELGDPAAQELLDDAEGFELSWYATQEIASLLESF